MRPGLEAGLWGLMWFTLKAVIIALLVVVVLIWLT